MDKGVFFKAWSSLKRLLDSDSASEHPSTKEDPEDPRRAWFPGAPMHGPSEICEGLRNPGLTPIFRVLQFQAPEQNALEDLFMAGAFPPLGGGYERFARKVLRGSDAKTVEIPKPVLSDKHGVNLLVQFTEYSESEAREVVAKWRDIADSHDYFGPVLWAVPADFELLTHAPMVGPCDALSFRSLLDWQVDQTLTRESLVFFVPRILHGSVSMSADEQRSYLDQERARRVLPDHHLRGFGSSSMVSSLIWASFKSLKNVLEEQYVRTDTQDGDGWALNLGYFQSEFWPRLSGTRRLSIARYSNVGVFPIGIDSVKR